VITKVGGKGVTSQDELREAVTGHKPGEQVAIDLIHRGKAETKNLALGERPAMAGAPGGGELEDMLGGLPEAQAKQVREVIEQNLKAIEGQVQPVPGEGAAVEGIPEALKQLQQRVGKAFRGMGGVLPGGQMQFNMQSSSSIRLMDEQGSVEMEMREGSKQVRVRDKQGKVQWEGPYDTVQDKAAVPDDARQRIDKMNFDVVEGGQGGGGLRMRIGPHGIEPPDVPPAPPKNDKEAAKPVPDTKPAE